MVKLTDARMKAARRAGYDATAGKLLTGEWEDESVAHWWGRFFAAAAPHLQFPWELVTQEELGTILNVGHLTLEQIQTHQCTINRLIHIRNAKLQPKLTQREAVLDVLFEYRKSHILVSAREREELADRLLEALGILYAPPKGE